MSVTEVYCRYGTLPASTDKANRPLPSTTVLVPVERADGWAEVVSGVDFSGYLVTARRVMDLPEGVVVRGR
ncbi:DUF6578 domain-containing protein [Streptomyces cinereoruber]|uniref:DUF6578 domain-containing protein n=1 Tax=Streptomyces cinereoruber TaxID=67260 RepID=UPI00345D4366